MPWTLTDDIDLYADRVWSLLAQDPVQHTLPLTVIETLRTGHRWSTDPVVFGWFTAPEDPRLAVGAVGMTPPFDLLLPVVPSGAMDELIAALREASVRVPGVRATPGLVADFSARWRSGTSLAEAGGERQRLYRLVTLKPPTGVGGQARRATIDDLELVTAFWEEFQIESHITRADAGPLVRGRVEAGLVWIWEVDAHVVSMAARNAIAAEVARVGPVYTPPAHRRHGYAAAVTSACSQDALDSGAGDVVLFTDLDNATSNSVYQSIGYEAVSDFETIQFA